jgi:hypothetical protein
MMDIENDENQLEDELKHLKNELLKGNVYFP